ncbi:hypothetical protein O181_076853 [Austropuccinia psidii MF-1]|uniref:Uncharacterized protein n=1 Tax=Austropuccinia psidii MF-1 TaxID=1389203 RepID=A0A9Q3FBP0_9BASI|nr:hypothetical protein [Austropuccinia psidii MF-1]
MPLQHSPPARHTRSQARTQAVLTPTPRAPLDGTPSSFSPEGQIGQRTHFGRRSTIQEGRKSVKKIKFLFRSRSDGTEAAPAPVGASEGTRGATIAQFDQPVSHQTEPSLLAIMQQMTQIMANLQAAASFEGSRPPAIKTPSMKAPECFDGTQPFKVRSFIQSCQLIFHNDLENFSQDRKKFLYATSF